MIHFEDSTEVQARHQEMPAILGETKWTKVFPGTLHDNNFKVFKV